LDRDLVEAVAAVTWFHQIKLAKGLVTPGTDESAAKLRRLHLPESFAGRSVLDIGAFDGFFSFDAEQRGAAEVLAIDSFIWDQTGPGFGKKGFELARKVLKSKVRDLRLEVMDIGVETVGMHDVVLFLGVFYHLEDPILALRKIASVTREMLVLETETMFTLLNRPEMFYTPGYLGDITNQWFPTPALVRDMLKNVGFRRVELVERHTTNWIPWRGRASFHAFK
jgi:tRNA (mo5U34)-methyltransferase